MKLKIGDKVKEDDGIVTIVYTIKEVTGGIALGVTEFEGKEYPTYYKSHYKSPLLIQPLYPRPDDVTRRILLKKK